MRTIKCVQHREQPFAVIDCRRLEASPLNRAARGVLGYRFAPPDDWTLNIKDWLRRGSREDAALSRPPMRMTTQELTEHTLAVWQSRTSHRLTNEDPREITKNITGLLTILAEWSRIEHHANAVDVTRHGDVTAGKGHKV